LDHPRHQSFGGTIIGGGIALVWAMRTAHRVGSTGSGGESGLNLFINDVKRISKENSVAENGLISRSTSAHLLGTKPASEVALSN
jgi:hypothetical protein